MDDDVDFSYLIYAGMDKAHAKYDMRKLGRLAGGVTRINVTIPSYLLLYLDCWTGSRSLFITFMIEDYMSRNEILPAKYPRLTVLYKFMKLMDKYAQKVKDAGGRNLETDRMMRAYRSYMHKFARAVRREMKKVMGIATVAKKAREVIPEPRIRTRPDLRRKQDAISKQEMGPEGYPETEDKRELYRTNKNLFKQIFPDLYTEWQAQDENKAEDDKQDPTDVEEDGADKPEDPPEK